MNTRDILNAVKEELTSLDSHLIDVLDIKCPTSLAYAKQLAIIVLIIQNIFMICKEH